MRALLIVGVTAAVSAAAIYALMPRKAEVEAVAAPSTAADPIVAARAVAAPARPARTLVKPTTTPVHDAAENAPAPPAYHDATVGAPLTQGLLVEFFKLNDEKLKTLPLPDEVDWTYLRGLHAWMDREPRDQAWASRAEAILKDHFYRQPFSGPGVELNIECRKTMCRVMAVGDQAQLTDGRFGDGGWQDLTRQFYEGPHAKEFDAKVSHGMLGGSQDFPGKTGMIQYFGRADAPKSGD